MNSYCERQKEESKMAAKSPNGLSNVQ